MVGQPGELAGYGPLTAHIARNTAAQLAQVCTFRFAVCHDDADLIAEGPIPTQLLPDLNLELRRWAADATAGTDGRTHRRPTAAQIAFVRARDRHCRAPGCRVPAHRCQLCRRRHNSHYAEVRIMPRSVRIVLNGKGCGVVNAA